MRMLGGIRYFGLTLTDMQQWLPQPLYPSQKQL